MTGFHEVARRLEQAGHPVAKAVPRSPGHLLLELSPGPVGGAPLPGQWYADADRADRVAASTARYGPVGRIGRHVVIQAGGADRRLTALRTLVRLDGATLVAHRPERRAVVRRAVDGGSCYVKVVRPGRTEAVARGLRAAAALGVPELGAVDDARGTVATSALPGTTWHAAWRTADAAARAPRAGAAVGRLVRELHTLPPDPDLPAHTCDDELRVTRRWLELADGYGVLPLRWQQAVRLLIRAARLLDADRDGVTTVIHRDLHDKQLMVDGDRVGLLDLDSLAVGDPALDLANLLVHLELRRHQGVAEGTLADEAAASVLDGYRPDPGLRRRLAGYALTTRLRLAAVYGFRPASRAAAASLLTAPARDRRYGVTRGCG